VLFAAMGDVAVAPLLDHVPDVVLLGSKPQMRRVHASAVVPARAVVEDVEARRDQAVGQFPGYARWASLGFLARRRSWICP
jgi:hypothetical protein